MPAITFTLNALPSAASKSLRFEPRNAPWVNTSGQVVTPDGFGGMYPRNTAQSVTLDTGPWRVRIGVEWFAFDVPAGGGDLKDLILFGVPASAPVSTITAAVNAYLADNPNGLLTRAVGDATYAPRSLSRDPEWIRRLALRRSRPLTIAVLTHSRGEGYRPSAHYTSVIRQTYTSWLPVVRQHRGDPLHQPRHLPSPPVHHLVDLDRQGLQLRVWPRPR